MVYGIHTEGRGGGVPCVVVLQTVWALQVGGGQSDDDWLVHKRVEVNEYLVKAKGGSSSGQYRVNQRGCARREGLRESTRSEAESRRAARGCARSVAPSASSAKQPRATESVVRRFPLRRRSCRAARGCARSVAPSASSARQPKAAERGLA